MVRLPWHRVFLAVAAPIAVACLAACGGDGDDAPPAGGASDAPGATALDGLIAAERAFAARSLETDMRTAFLEFFAPDVVTFTPEPVVGTAALEAGPPGPELVWWPEVAEVSAAGDMGYTSGPYRARGPDGAASWGHYHSVWGRRGDGSWHVLLDIGGPHGEVAIPTTVERPEPPPGTAEGSAATAGAGTGAADAPGTGAGIRGAEAAFRAAYEEDPGAAVGEWLLPRARVYRPGRVPFEGRAASLDDREASGEHLTWEVEGSGAAASGDLGYAWGTGTLARSDLGGEARPTSWARVWRRGADGWKVALEVVLAR